jgi:soluble cytochrome b562
MKSPLLPAATFLLLALTFSTSQAGTVLGGSMKKMEEACKQLGPDLKQVDATKHNKDLDLQSVAAIKAECLKSRDLTPKKELGLPPDQQQAMTKDYQKDMDAFTLDVDTLNQDIQGEKWDAARIDFKKLMDDQHADHKLYRVKQ